MLLHLESSTECPWASLEVGRRCISARERRGHGRTLQRLSVKSGKENNSEVAKRTNPCIESSIRLLCL
jgi:hypothetical protein